MRLVAALAACAAVAGCNSARVVQTNLERTSRLSGRPAQQAWPVHPYARPTQNNPYRDTPTVRANDDPEPPDREADVVQTAAQRPTDIISGRVVDSSGRPQPGVSIVATASQRSGGRKLEATSDAAGNFRLRGLQPGQRYLILASAIRRSAPLIGRVATVPPDQGIVIEIAPPFTAQRSHHPTRRIEDLDEPSIHQPLTPRGNGRAGIHRENPFAASAAPQTRRVPISRQHSEPNPNPAFERLDGAPVATSTQRTTGKRTREQIAADHRLDSPWDMPAPSTKKTPPTTTIADRSDRSDRSDLWDNASLSQPIADPRRPLSQPLDVAAPNAPPPQVPTRGSPTAAESAETDDIPPITTPAPTNSDPLPPLGDQPMCEFDGNRLVDFQLPGADGAPVRFRALGSRFVLIDFWTTWCGPCLRAVPHLSSLQRRYGPQGLQVIGVACETGSATERSARVNQVREQLGISYPLLLDDGTDKFLLRDKFGVSVYPTLVLVDHTGRVVWRSEGPDQADYHQLEKLLKTQFAAAPSGYN